MEANASKVLGPFAETLDAASSQGVSAESLLGDSSSVSSRVPHVRLIEGSGVELTRETRILLRSRLRAAAFVLALGFGVFIIWRIVASALDVSPMLLDGTFVAQVAVFFLLVSCALPLCRTCEYGSWLLRLEELIIFGSPAAFFFFMQMVTMRECAAKDNMLPRPDAPWLMLMFTYAMFIPNTWRRAAVVIGTISLSPILLTIVLWQSDQICATLIGSDLWTTITMGLIMVVSGVVSIVGVHTINVLRVEAYQARQLGQYRLGNRIGSGGMGEVYSAEHQLMKRPVAIKVIRPEKAGDSRVLARFEREVRATAKLSHWNNIDIFDYGRADDGTFYYVMELLPGLSLAELVEKHGPLPPERVIFLLRQTCEALAEAHATGLIHRDIKPANIFAAERGRLHDVAKLLDFGMAKPLDSIDSPELTHDGSITGSPLFMSPEQATSDREPDERSDIYSLGVVAYYVLTGRVPFEGTQPVKILLAHAQQTPTRPSELSPDVPLDLEAVVMRCLAKSPEGRYATADELARALDGCQHATGWSHADAALWWRNHCGTAYARAGHPPHYAMARDIARAAK